MEVPRKRALISPLSVIVGQLPCVVISCRKFHCHNVSYQNKPGCYHLRATHKLLSKQEKRENIFGHKVNKKNVSTSKLTPRVDSSLKLGLFWCLIINELNFHHDMAVVFQELCNLIQKNNWIKVNNSKTRAGVLEAPATCVLQAYGQNGSSCRSPSYYRLTIEVNNF